MFSRGTDSHTRAASEKLRINLRVVVYSYAFNIPCRSFLQDWVPLAVIVSLLEGRDVFTCAASFKSYYKTFMALLLACKMQEIDGSLARTIRSYDTIQCNLQEHFSLLQAGSEEARMRASLDEKSQLIETLREQVTVTTRTCAVVCVCLQCM